ncbi:hypothetical protein AWB78_08695 [Caballeronia calidae]|uniref:Uncharacterized protein n=1 Tax=Caballeronia calidae TaxID=1777139 RepID=A0A158ELG2_9BURK|nr:hypothetical protein AWB78_08695 [Caballeronia calidae]
MIEIRMAGPNRSQKWESICPGIPALPSEFVPGLLRLIVAPSGLTRRVHNAKARTWPLLMPPLASPTTVAPLSIKRTL